MAGRIVQVKLSDELYEKVKNLVKTGLANSVEDFCSYAIGHEVKMVEPVLEARELVNKTYEQHKADEEHLRQKLRDME